MFKRFLRSIILREKASSEKYISFLRKKGVDIGENVRFFSPTDVVVDLTCPWLLSIGNNVNITRGVVILTHDYSWSVLKQTDFAAGEILGAQSPVKIGNNVFIGMNTVITRGVRIEDNVIIGAGSVVSRDCKTGGVYAGVPAKRIMSVADYYKKRKDAQFDEAREIAREYRKRFNKMPPKEVFYEYFMLFSNSDDVEKTSEFRKQLKTGGNYEESLKYMKENKPFFESYEEFLSACFSEE